MAAVELWGHVGDVHGYERWWPWLRVSGPDRLATGEAVRLSIPSPLGYRVRVTLCPTLTGSDDGGAVVADVHGDLRGVGRLQVTSLSSGRAELSFGWQVSVERPMLKALARVLRPLLTWGHNRVVARATEQFLGAVRRTSEAAGRAPKPSS